MAESRRTRIVRICTLLALLAAPACSLKYAPSSFSDATLTEGKESLAIEGGLVFLDGQTKYGRIDLGLNASYQTFDYFTDAALSRVEFTGRLLPRPEGTIQPYLGLGLGLYRLAATETTRRCGRQAICVDSQLDQHSIETGINPHWTAGVEIFPGQRTTGLVLGITHEFASSGQDWDLGGFRFGAGIVYRPR